MRKGVGEGGAHGTGRCLAIEGEGHPSVSGLLEEAGAPAALLVLGHGAGAPMTHPFMEKLARALAAAGISTLRYNFPYAEAGRRPDPARRLLAVVASALRAGREAASGLPLFAGGKSMSGRMTSTLVAERAAAAPGPSGRDAPGDGHEPAGEPDSPAAARASRFAPATSGLPAGIVFFGFPLHPPGRPATERGDHLDRVPHPMLFHQGTRDRLADLALLGPLVTRLGRRAALHIVEGGDHSLNPLKRSGRTLDDVLAEVAAVTRNWIDRIVAEGTTMP